MSEPEPQPPVAELIARVDAHGARRAIAGATVHTPTLISAELSERLGGSIALKAECLQGTGSFKLRGALNKVAALGDRAGGGLVTASAGNHGRAVAQAARLRGIACEVFMPRDAPVSKVAAVERLGAHVRLEGDSVEEAVELALERAAAGAAFVHPFDDLDVIAGQATLGLELLEDVPDLARVILPVGGGGLASGVAIALRSGLPEVEIVGVQARAFAPFARAFADPDEVMEEHTGGVTIADGIALKRPGTLTLPLVRELLSSIETVSEDEIADAMVFLADRAKLVAEGAGAVAVAALLSGRVKPAPSGRTVAIVSGGNVDSGLLAGLLRRRETEEGRRVRIFTRVPDRPGALAELLGLIAEARANLLSLEHVREAVTLGVRETGVELTLETRGPEHTESLVRVLAGAGYEVTVE